MPWTWATASWTRLCAATPGWWCWSGATSGILPREDVPKPVDLVTLDLSFISLTLVLPRRSWSFSRPGGEVLALVKPQFEVGKGKVGKGGVVRDPQLQQEAVARRWPGPRPPWASR